MAGIILIQDLAVVMAVAAIITLICHRFHIPLVLGYILAGFIIGPHTPPYSFVKDPHSIETLSELGVVFLLFAIGLEFSLSRLVKVGLVAIFAATLEILLMILIGYFLGKAFGWNFIDSLFLGTILSISSTTIIAKVLMETKKISEKFAQVILGILIIEDVIAIIIIAVLSGLVTSGVITFEAIGQTAIRVVIFTVVFLILGFLFIPRLLRYLEKISRPEMLVISILGLCFAGALVAVKAGFSVALGAFLIGAIIAETRQIKKVIQQIEPIRDMFTAVFFVAVGMMIKPQNIIEFWLPILVITIVTIFGKVLSCSSATFLAGYRPDTALMVGLGLAQIGEFSFIIANLGESTKVTSSFLYPITVSVSAITTLTTPFLMRGSANVTTWLRKITPEPVQAFLGLYTAWIQSIGQTGKSKRALLGEMFRASKTHLAIERMITEIINPDTAGKITHDELVKFIRQEYPWEVETDDFLIPYTESALTQKLSELRLRSETGATIVSIYRDEESIPNPSADTQLKSGDVLLILGTKEQVKDAISFLQKKAQEAFPATPSRQGVPKTQSFHVRSGLSCIGKTIGEIKLKRRSGATILGIQKAEQIIHNPNGEMLIEEGDVLMLFGWPDQLQTASDYLRK
jgi:CPA2 family monovalent cation:H+ antiporter-2